MDHLGGVKELEYLSWGADSFRGIAAPHLMDSVVYSVGDSTGLPDNPGEFEGCFKEDPTTRKWAREIDDEDTRYTDTKQTEDLLPYIPILKYDFAIGNPFFLLPEEVEYASLELRMLRAAERQEPEGAEA